MKIKFLEIKRVGSRLQVSLPTPVKIWAGRVAAAATIALVNATIKGQMPHSLGEWSALGTGAVVAATPVFQKSGLFRQAAPGQPSKAEAAVASLKAFVAAPKAQQEQKLVALAEKAAEDKFSELTSGFQRTAAGLVPISNGTLIHSNRGDEIFVPQDTAQAGSGIPTVAGVGDEVVAPQEEKPAVLQQPA